MNVIVTIKELIMPNCRTGVTPSVAAVCATTTHLLLHLYHVPDRAKISSGMMSSKRREPPRTLNRYLISEIPFKSPLKCKAC